MFVKCQTFFGEFHEVRRFSSTERASKKNNKMTLDLQLLFLPWSAVRSLEVDGEGAQAAVRGEAKGGASVEYLTSGGDKIIGT